MYEHITREYIKDHQFLCDGLYFEREKTDVDYKFAPGAHIPEHPEKMEIELRKKIVNLVVSRCDNNYSKIEADTGVKRSTIYKFITKNTETRRGLTREALAKLCVGLKLPMEEVQEYFRLQGHVLNPEDNLLDAIVVNCIESDGDIYEFKDMCEEYELNIRW